MARYFIGASPMARFSQSRGQGEGQVRRREARCGGSPIQSCGAMNKNRIGGVVHPGRAGTWPQSPPSAVGMYFVNPASMQRR